ncbi:MAG TPA: hypothetical protein VGU20_07825 [Stellaceae bacterium]|nr:hypothetical protein [Stellaceae bacterium]
MLDIATRKELAALVYERAELETDSPDHPIFLADDGEHFAPTRRWYDVLLHPGALVC